MKLIIPMAGIGKRLRPHTLVRPKPLIPIAGQPIVQRLIDQLMNIEGLSIDTIHYVIGDFGQSVEKQLKELTDQYNCECKISYQNEAKGTAHAVHCANSSLTDQVVIAFADTLIDGHMKINPNKDGTIWVKKVDDPSKYGVVTLNSDNNVKDFVEKPKDNISDKAIIGIYFFRDGEQLKNEIDYLIQNDIKGNNEFQLTDALENMNRKGYKFGVDEIDQWMDCGNVNALLDANEHILQKEGNLNLTEKTSKNIIIIPPCYIESGVRMEHSVIGPYVSVYKDTVIQNSIIQSSIVDEATYISQSNLKRCFIGQHNTIKESGQYLSTGSYTHIE